MSDKSGQEGLAPIMDVLQTSDHVVNSDVGSEEHVVSDSEFIDDSAILHEDKYCYVDCTLKADSTILIGCDKKSCTHMQCIGLTPETICPEQQRNDTVLSVC